MSNKHKTKVEHEGLKQTPTAYNIPGFQVQCLTCHKKIQGVTESQVLNNLRVHMMVHDKDEVKV